MARTLLFKLFMARTRKDGRLLETIFTLEARDSAQTSVHIYHAIRVTYQKERNLPFKTNFRTIDLCTNAEIKIQVTFPLPTTCLGFLDVSASLKPIKQFQGKLLQKVNWTRKGENTYRKNTLLPCFGI